MSRAMGAAANRLAPWRQADWRVLLIEGWLLIAAGIALLADGERAEFILGLMVAAAMLADGLRRWRLGFRRLDPGRTRDLTLIRGAVGIVTGGLVLALSLLQQITVLGIRIAIGVGGLAYALLGIALAVPVLRRRQLSWTSVVFDVLLLLVALLLLYRVVSSEAIAGLLAVTSWLVLGTGVAIVFAGLIRRAMQQKPDRAATDKAEERITPS